MKHWEEVLGVLINEMDLTTLVMYYMEIYILVDLGFFRM